MKKIAIITLTVLLLALTALGVGAASFGTGAIAVAEEVTMIKTGLLGKKLCFNDADFKSALCLPDFDTITVTNIPSSTEGTLLLSGRRVGEGRVIKKKHLGALVFVPKSSEITESRFKFTVEGYAGGAEIECTMKFIDKVNYAPSVPEEAVSIGALSTQENISAYGTLAATDPEGDSIEFIIAAYPKAGVLELLDKEAGRYKYTPSDSFTGSDSFVYVARDEYGNYTSPTRVKVSVHERMCEVVYTDMEDREEYGAAVAMTAMGIMGGRLLGDDVYFMPEEKITKAEFVALAMKSAGIRSDSTISASYFDDDADIPTSLVGYVATAQRLGIINGDFKGGRLVFSPNEPITKYEAAKIMSTLLGSDGEGEESVFNEDDAMPVWARAGVYAMYSLGIFDEGDIKGVSEAVTRADAAEYLYKMMKS